MGMVLTNPSSLWTKRECLCLGPAANCGAGASLPAFPLPLKLQDRMAVIYSVLSLSIAAR